MINFKQKEYVRPIPVLQMVSLIDILFVTLSFFMALSLHFNFESELNVSVPSSKTGVDMPMSSEDIVINILRDGEIVINQKKISSEQLEALLKKTADLYPSQGVILRADEKTFHQSVVHVLDICSSAKIWNISFATNREN